METKRKWELEMSICITDEEWGKTCLNSQKLTSKKKIESKKIDVQTLFIIRPKETPEGGPRCYSSHGKLANCT